MKKLLSISFAISLIFSMVSFCFTSYAEGYPNVTSKSTITSVDSIGAGATGYNLATDGSKVSLTSSATFNKQVQTTFSVSNMSDLIKLADWDNGKIAIDFTGTFNTGSSAFCYIKAKWDGGEWTADTANVLTSGETYSMLFPTSSMSTAPTKIDITIQNYSFGSGIASGNFNISAPYVYTVANTYEAESITKSSSKSFGTSTSTGTGAVRSNPTSDYGCGKQTFSITNASIAVGDTYSYTLNSVYAGKYDLYATTRATSTRSVFSVAINEDIINPSCDFAVPTIFYSSIKLGEFTVEDDGHITLTLTCTTARSIGFYVDQFILVNKHNEFVELSPKPVRPCIHSWVNSYFDSSEKAISTKCGALYEGKYCSICNVKEYTTTYDAPVAHEYNSYFANANKSSVSSLDLASYYIKKCSVCSDEHILEDYTKHIYDFSTSTYAWNNNLTQEYKNGWVKVKSIDSATRNQYQLFMNNLSTNGGFGANLDALLDDPSFNGIVGITLKTNRCEISNGSASSYQVNLILSGNQNETAVSLKLADLKWVGANGSLTFTYDLSAYKGTTWSSLQIQIQNYDAGAGVKNLDIDISPIIAVNYSNKYNFDNHSIGDTPCTEDKVCFVCNSVVKSGFSHSFENGICTECGDIDSTENAVVYTTETTAPVAGTRMSDSKQFVCLLNSNGTVIPAGQIVPAGTYTAVGIGATMAYGAQVRLKSDNGIRFISAVDKESFDKLAQLASEVGYGTRIAPTDTLGSETTRYIYAQATGFYSSDSDSYFIAGSIVNIKSQNLNRGFTGQGYITFTFGTTEVTIYANLSDNSRSIYNLSKASLADVKSSFEVGYENEITLETDEHFGKFSPYTPTQRLVLKDFVNAYENK